MSLRPLRVASFVTLICLIAGQSGCQARARPEPPRIDVSRGAGTIGKLPQSFDRQSVAVPIRNSGGEQLVIHAVDAHCGCTAASLSHAQIPPGESATLTVLIDRSVAAARTARITISSNDPAQPVVDIPFAWEPIGKYSFSTKAFEFGEVAPGAVATGVLTLRENDAGNERAPNRGPPRVKASPPQLKCTVAKLQTGMYELRIAFEAAPALENVTGEISIFDTDSRAPECILPVRWKIKSDLSAEPRSLFLGRGAPGATLSGRVVLSANAAARLDLSDLNVSSPGSEVQLSKTALSDGRVQVDVRFECPDKPGGVSFEITATCGGDLPRTVIVPVFALVGAGSHETSSK